MRFIVRGCMLLLTAVLPILILTTCGNAPQSEYAADAYEYDTILQIHSSYNYMHDEGQVLAFAHYHGIVFDDTNVLDRNQRGLTTQARVGVRRYMFSKDDEIAKLSFIYDTERLIDEIDDIMTIQSGLAVITMLDGHQYWNVGNNISVCHDNINTHGWLVHHFSLRRFPMWLSVGIETVARSNRGLFEPPPLYDFDLQMPNFSDLNFAPRAWGLPEHRQAIYTAYHFIRFLQNQGSLNCLVSLYKNGDHPVATETATYYFGRFSNLNAMLGLILELTMDGKGGNVPCNPLHVRASTNYGHYEFSLYGPYSRLDAYVLAEIVEFLEEGKLFAKDFFLEYYDFDFIPITHRLHLCDTNGTGGAAFIDGAHYVLSGSSSFILWGIHEITHLIQAHAGVAYFFPIGEGIAEFMVDFFLGETGRDDFNKRRYTRHKIAAAVLTSGLYLQGASDYARALGFHEGSQRYVPEINRHSTSFSFTHFLIQEYGIEKFMEAHALSSSVVERFAEVYGMTINEMVGIWREFLEQSFCFDSYSILECACEPINDEPCCSFVCVCEFNEPLEFEVIRRMDIHEVN